MEEVTLARTEQEEAMPVFEDQYLDQVPPEVATVLPAARSKVRVYLTGQAVHTTLPILSYMREEIQWITLLIQEATMVTSCTRRTWYLWSSLPR